MNYQESIKTIKQSVALVAGAITVSVITAVVAFELIPQGFNAHTSLRIIQNTQQETEDFKYDRYYALEASESIADFAEQSLSSPEVVSELLGENTLTARQLRKFFNAQAVSQQLVRIKFEAGDYNYAQSVVASAQESVNASLDGILTGQDSDTTYRVQHTPITILPAGPQFMHVILAAAIGGLLLGIVAVFLIDATRNENRD